MITLRQILNSRSQLLDGRKVKVVRHRDDRAEYRDLIKDRDGLLEYQKKQDRDVFGDCDYIISLRGLDRSRALFFGVFAVNGKTVQDGNYYYDLECIPEFNCFTDRLIIGWRSRGWHQWYDRNNKEVLEILPEGYIGTFPGLLDFVLEFDELRTLIRNPDANFDWRHHLSAVNGVYLILDSRTGQQYIGSACGANGIWGRWSDYAAGGNGGNKELVALQTIDPHHHRHFRFSVLQSLPSNITQREIVSIENLYKEKLGARAHGLNRN